MKAFLVSYTYCPPADRDSTWSSVVIAESEDDAKEKLLDWHRRDGGLEDSSDVRMVEVMRVLDAGDVVAWPDER